MGACNCAATACQPEWRATQSTQVVVEPSPDLEADDPRILRLQRVAAANVTVRGLPPALLEGHQIVVRLSDELPSNLVGHAQPRRDLIVLPAAAVAWDAQELAHVVRHEFAHLALGAYFDYQELPIWLDEGFAKWVESSFDCRAEARIRLDMGQRLALGRPPPSLYEAGRWSPEPVRNEYYGLFLGYLDQQSSGALSNGTVLSALRARGIRAGVLEVLGADITELEASWQAYLAERFGDIPVDFSCRQNR